MEKLKIHEERYAKARALVAQIRKTHWPGWSKNRNIVGMSFGQRTVGNEIVDEPALVVYVIRKTNESFVRPSHLLPRRIYVGADSVDVDVRETGVLYPISFTARERPATAGISIGNVNENAAGTLGSVVFDNTDNAACILSNNHVLARENAAGAGEAIVQPGVYDGGTASDEIARLRRFVTINAAGNTADCAIAAIGALGTDVVDQVHNNIIAVAGPDHPAVGLLFAGGCNTTIINPIDQVLTQLDVRFGNANATVGPDIGMNVEKVGRTTEYTTSTIREIDATVTISYDFGSATFDHQIVTRWMSDAGDSGSLVYRGGNGGDEDHCGCLSTSSAENILGTRLTNERALAQTARDKFLRPTLLGGWAVRVFEMNERTLNDRVRKMKFEGDDLTFARSVIGKYRGSATEALARGEKSEQRVTDEHIGVAHEALQRAQKYMSDEEREATQRLFDLGAEVARGKNAPELMALLNDKELLEQVQQIAMKVSTLRLK